MKRVVYFVGDNVFGKVSILFVTGCKDNARILNYIKSKFPYDDAVLTCNKFDVYIYNLHIGDNIYKLIIESVEDIDL